MAEPEDGIARYAAAVSDALAALAESAAADIERLAGELGSPFVARRLERLADSHRDAARAQRALIGGSKLDPKPWVWAGQRFASADPAGQDFDFHPEFEPQPEYSQTYGDYYP